MSMNEQESRGDTISATISGNVSGQVAVGKQITQTQTIGAPAELVTDKELEDLRAAFAALKTQIVAQAPPEKKEAAAERVAELEEAVHAKEPDLDTISYVKNWFTKNLPGLAGAVTGLVIHPIVGKVVGAAGEALASEFKSRFKE